MKYIFFGTPRFAEIVLEGLLRGGMPPMALVCNPDRPVGRKKIITPPLTKTLVSSQKKFTEIEVLQPEKLDDIFIEHLKKLNPDFFVVAAYAKIIPKAVLDVPRLGTLGVHPSLLPKYRGSSPIQSVILSGEDETGVTIYQMDEKMDHGPIFKSEKIKMDSLKTNYLELEKELVELSAALLLKVIPELLAGKTKPHVQDESRATYTKKFTTQDGFVAETDFDAATGGDAKKAEAIIRKINALGEEPGVWIIKNNKRVKLLEAEVRDQGLKLLRIQEEGGRPKRA